MPPGIQPSVKVQTPPEGFLGLDTASEPTSISLSRSRRLLNAFQGKLRALTKRPGSVPVASALGSPITHLMTYPFSKLFLVVSGTAIYKYVSGALTSLTMTNVLSSADVFDADFTGIHSSAPVNIKLIADGSTLKKCDGVTVSNVTPAASDTSPAPSNVLTNINTLGIKFIWEYSQFVFVSPGDNQVFYSKRAGQGGTDYQYDYFPETHFSILVKNGDYINGCGIPFDDVCFIPMRRGWNVLTGENFNNFNFGEYLNTINGLIAPKSAQIITYADGQQTIAYLSDDGVHEIYTTVLDNRGKQYATRSLMSNKIDFKSMGFTISEKQTAISKYVVDFNMYLLEITRDTTNYVFGYDTRNGEWYMWTGLQINSLMEFDGSVFFAGDDGKLKIFDYELYTDWTNISKTTGTPVDFYRISGMISFEDTGYPSMLDYYILRLKQYAVKASLDISIVHMRDTVAVENALKNYFLIWDIGTWDEAVWANADYTDLVSAPLRLSTKLKLPKQAFYFQIRWRNNRNEPCEIYGESLIARTSGEI